jgi:hypothetical protein
MPHKADAQVLQVLERQARQNGLVDFVFAKGRFIAIEPEAAQPSSDVHGNALTHRIGDDLPHQSDVAEG